MIMVAQVHLLVTVQILLESLDGFVHRKPNILKGGQNGQYAWTASMLQMHRHGMVVCDEEACEELKISTYNYFKDKQKLEGVIDEYLHLF
jgi:hypothetical protein